jgi:hypothetical protein
MELARPAWSERDGSIGLPQCEATALEGRVFVGVELCASEVAHVKE